MKAVSLYLDECISRGVAANDADIARKVGVHRSAVSQWRLNMTAPAEDAAAKLAELLGKPEVMAECAAARAKTPEGRRMWERLARIAAAAVVVAAVTTHESYADVNTQRAYKGLLFSELKTRALALLSWIVNRFSRDISRSHSSLFAAGAHGCVGA